MAGRWGPTSGFYQPLINQIRTPVRFSSQSALHSLGSASPPSLRFQISAHRKITLLHCLLLHSPSFYISLFRLHSFFNPTPPLPGLLFLSSLFLLAFLVSWFKSSGLSLSACGSSKTNGSSLHLLLIIPHPPPPLPCLTSPLPRPLPLLRPPFSSSPPPFFPSERVEKKKKKRDNWG